MNPILRQYLFIFYSNTNTCGTAMPTSQVTNVRGCRQFRFAVLMLPSYRCHHCLEQK